jgi:quinol monooxygenase YgiN
MIAVAARVAINPERREQAVAAAIKLVHGTQQETGCLQYHFYADLEDPTTFHVFEEWETEEALAAHFHTPHWDEFAAALPEILAGEPKVMRYTVTAVDRLM